MDIIMPQLGETVAEGKITKWFKNAGDTVAPGDNLFEIETDKTSMEVPATSRRHALGDPSFQVGDVAPVGAVVAVILGDAAKSQRRISLRANASGALKLRSPPRRRGSRPKNWVPAFAGTSGSRSSRRPCRWICSAKSAPRNAISVRRGSRAASR